VLDLDAIRGGVGFHGRSRLGVVNPERALPRARRFPWLWR
jgi:hypothetical protein